MRPNEELRKMIVCLSEISFETDFEYNSIVFVCFTLILFEFL